MPDDRPFSRPPRSASPSRPSVPASGWTPPRRSPWPARLLVLAVLGAGGAALIFTDPGQRAGRALSRRLFPPPERSGGRMAEERRVVIREKIVEKRVEVPVEGPPPALPSGPALSPRGGDLNTLFSGIGLKTTLLPSQGDTATKERAEDGSYVIEMVLKVKIPKPASTMEQLKPLNPGLGQLLPDLATMVGKGKVSGFFHHLYDLKEKAVAANLKRLDRLPSRHNFYDLDALLELEHPGTRQKVLLMQADMDVVSDGSDGDRLPSFDDYIFKSAHFQPTTSYGWAKTTTRPNPVIPMLEEELREVREKLKSPGLTRTEKPVLASRAEAIPRIVADLQRRSYLIGQEDPFIVIPSSLRNYKGRNAWAPAIGDYAVVIHNNQLLPAVVGDYGPTIKVGEASLRIAREIDPKAGPYRRPVSDLKVTYLIFPDSADAQRRAPDYAAWRARCQELVGRIGGLGTGVSLHEWEDRLKPGLPVPGAAVTTSPGAAVPLSTGPSANAGSSAAAGEDAEPDAGEDEERTIPGGGPEAADSAAADPGPGDSTRKRGG